MKKKSKSKKKTKNIICYRCAGQIIGRISMMGIPGKFELGLAAHCKECAIKISNEFAEKYPELKKIRRTYEK